MLPRLSEGFEASKKIARKVYGKRLIYSGIEDKADLTTLRNEGAKDILIRFPYIRQFDSVEELLEGFDIVAIDPDYYYMLDNLKTVGACKAYCNEYISFLERFGEHFTFVIEPAASRAIIGEDFSNAWIEEMQVRGFNVMPYITVPEDTVFLTESGNLDPVTAAAVDHTVFYHEGHSRAVQTWAKRHNVWLIGSGVQEAANMDSSNYAGFISPAWKNGQTHNTTYFYYNGRFEKFLQKDQQTAFKRRKEHILSLGFSNMREITTPLGYNRLNLKAWRAFEDKLMYDYRRQQSLSDLEYAEAQDDYIKNRNPDGALLPTKAEDTQRIMRRDRVINKYIKIEDEEGRTFIDARSVMAAQCDSCELSSVCPMYDAGSDCAFKTFSPIQGKKDLEAVMGNALGISYNRLQQEYLKEKLTGNVGTPEMTKQMNDFFKNAEIYNKVIAAPKTSGSNPVIGALNQAIGDANPQGNSLVQKIMSDAVKTVVVEVEAEKL